MRDPKRCPAVCDLISYHWQTKCPDWRFMQLMSNFVVWYGADPFYMEDEEFIKKFREFLEKNS